MHSPQTGSSTAMSSSAAENTDAAASRSSDRQEILQLKYMLQDVMKEQNNLRIQLEDKISQVREDLEKRVLGLEQRLTNSDKKLDASRTSWKQDLAKSAQKLKEDIRLDLENLSTRVEEVEEIASSSSSDGFPRVSQRREIMTINRNVLIQNIPEPATTTETDEQLRAQVWPILKEIGFPDDKPLRMERTKGPFLRKPRAIMVELEIAPKPWADSRVMEVIAPTPSRSSASAERPRGTLPNQPEPSASTSRSRNDADVDTAAKSSAKSSNLKS